MQTSRLQKQNSLTKETFLCTVSPKNDDSNGTLVCVAKNQQPQRILQNKHLKLDRHKVNAANNPRSRKCQQNSASKHCTEEILICQEDLPFVAGAPGYYKLCGDAVYSPTDEYAAAITILANNVTIDLSGFTLSQVDKSVANIYGIQIGQGYNYTDPDAVLTNTSIKNGNIIDFSGIGILAYNASFDGPTAQIPFQDIQLLDLNILDCGPLTALFTGSIAGNILTITEIENGIITLNQPISDVNGILSEGTIITGFLTGVGGIGTYSINISQNVSSQTIIMGNESSYFASGLNLDSVAPTPFTITPDTLVAYSGVIINRCNINRSIGHAAIQVYPFDNLTMKNVQANDTLTNIDSFGYCYGYILSGRNLEMYQCQGNGSTDLDPTPISQTHFGQCGGIYLISSINIYLEDCQFNDSFGQSSYIVNNNLGLNASAIFRGCQFNNTTGGDLAVGVFGVHYSESQGEDVHTQATEFIDCQFNGTSISDNAAGFGLFSIVGGLWGHGSVNTIVDGCQACNIQSTNPGYSAFGISIGLEPHGDLQVAGGTRNIVIRKCVTSDISTIGSAAAGIFLNSINLNFGGYQLIDTNYLIEDCTIQRITAHAEMNSGLLNRLAAGITETIFNFNHDPLFINYGSQFPATKNVIVRNCTVTDVHNYNLDTGEIAPIPQSAGIFIGETQNSVLEDNIVLDCDRGILFSGTDALWPNGFQLATSFENATAIPPIFIDLGSAPSPSPIQTFENITEGNEVNISPIEVTGIIPGAAPNYFNIPNGTIDTTLMFILPTEANLTDLNWQSGDSIVYDCNGGSPISGLVCGQTYYLIVYNPGFTEKGLVQHNKVSNCIISGFQDDKVITSSVWIDNTATFNGINYEIKWPNDIKPLDIGTNGIIPPGGNKYYNLDLN